MLEPALGRAPGTAHPELSGAPGCSGTLVTPQECPAGARGDTGTAQGPAHGDTAQGPSSQPPHHSRGAPALHAPSGHWQGWGGPSPGQEVPQINPATMQLRGSGHGIPVEFQPREMRSQGLGSLHQPKLG